MAPSTEPELRNPDQRTLHVWSKPLEPQDPDQAQGQGQDLQGSPRGPQDGPGNRRPTFSDAIATIRKEDFASVASTPCARQGLLVGIASGAGFGGLSFVLRGNAIKAANWAAGTFVLGSVVCYEYCQFQRRAERMQMKRHIEVVAEGKRELARRAAEEREMEQRRMEQEQSLVQRPWYKFW